MQAQRPAGVATRAGFITGLFVGILSLPVITLSRFTSGAALGLFFLLVSLVAFGIAGYIATHRSGLLRSGVGAGALAALIAIFIAICLGVVIVALLAPQAAFASRGLGGGPIGRGFGGRGVLNPGVRAFPRVRTAIVALFLALLLIMGTGVLGGFLGALLGRLGRPRQPVAPQFAPAGFAPQFTAPPAAPAAPTVPHYPSNPSGATPPPYYPPTPPYDPNAPTTPSGPNGA